MTSPVSLERRRFLTTAVASAGAVALARCGAGGPNSCGVTGAQVTVAEVPVGSWVRPLNASYIVAHDAAGFYAYSAICTHQGCTIGCPDGQGNITCPCHGAQYDGNGNVTVPVIQNQANLDHYAVTFQGSGSAAVIVVDTGTVVPDRGARVSAPA